MNTDDLVQLALTGGSPTATPALPSFFVDTDEDAAAVVAWFGQDPEREAVFLVVGNTSVGQLARVDLYSKLAGKTLGFGDSVGWTLPGTPTTWRPTELFCTGSGCGPHYAVKYNPKRPPDCPMHHTPLRKYKP